MRKIILMLIALIPFLSYSQSDATYPFYDTKLSLEDRIEDLINRLTLEEKTSLMLYNSPAIDHLNIPEYNWWNESLHGVGRAGLATVFPQAIGLAATFDTTLIYRISTAISDEARAKYNVFRERNNYQQYTGLTFWSPNVNIFRDPRWGRGQETYGEDPFLSGLLGRNYVRGMQGDDPNHLKVAACAKHFAVHSGPEESRHSFNALPGEYDLYNTYLPAFRMLSDARVEAFMCAYNQVFDHPCCANEFLLKDILRNDWKFKGHVVSDCWAISDYVKFQDYSENEAEAAAASILAGVNLNCGSSYRQLQQAIDLGLITEGDLDEALIPNLRTRFKLGMFDPKGASIYDTLSDNVINCSKHIDLAYEAACKSIVLLSNKNNCLPLNKDEIQKLFITGPMAADIMTLLGNYNGLSKNMVTPLEGILDRVGANMIVDYTIGTQLAKSNKFNGVWQASSADAVVVFLGNNRLLEGENGDAMLNDHGGDRISIELPDNQIELIRKLKNEAKAKKIVVVISGGSAIACPEIIELADAVLFNWYSGEQGGNAIADILFGNVNPSGKLPVTFYKNTKDLPPFDDYSMDNRTYKYFKGEVLFPFGYGLNYSNSKIMTPLNTKPFELNMKSLSIKINAKVENNSDFSSREVIQVYAKPTSNLLDKDINRMLIDIHPMVLLANSEKELSIDIPLKQLEIYNESDKKYAIPTGNIIIEITNGNGEFLTIGKIHHDPN